MEVSAENGSSTRPTIQPAVLVTSGPSPELAAAEAAQPAMAMAPPPPAPMPPAQQDTLGGELEGLNFFKGVTFGGFLDAYYNFDFNEPSDAIVTNGGAGLNRNFDFNHNSLTLSQVDFEVMKTVNETNPLGYMVQMTFGPTATFVNVGDVFTGNFTSAHFMQYYLSGRAGKLTLDFGKFVTQHGAEVIDTRADWNYSRGLLFALAIPYYHFGLRATYPVSDKVTLAAYLVNGWNNVIDNNKGKTGGFQLVWNPTSRVGFVQNYMVGQEQTGASDVRHLIDSLLTVKLHDKVTFMTNYDYGMDRVGGDHVHWQGIAGYLKFQPTPKFALIPRFEFYSDPMGITTGTRQQLKEFTLTPEFIVSNNLVMRFEYRHDWSNEPSFTTSGDPKDDPKKQDTLGVGMILKF
ncbi:MAG: porin [Acidobacteria bacterium]|nr:porin [Acidobacteriota bacterium]